MTDEKDNVKEKAFKEPAGREEIERLHEKGLNDAFNDATSFYEHSMIAHEEDIPDISERRKKAGDDMIASAILFASGHYDYEPTGDKEPDQPQKKKNPGGSGGGRALPDAPASPEYFSLDDFRSPSGK